ncbi:MAG: phage tail tape measure protein [Desulfovibrionaceae bacterium]|nr:phage tail tape measure protein [Desulfovibrionaceae bacterium]
MIGTQIIISAKDFASQTFNRTRLAAKGLHSTLTSLAGPMAMFGAGMFFPVKRAHDEFKKFETALVDMARVTDQPLAEIKRNIMAMPESLGSATELMQGYYQVISSGITDSAKAMKVLTVAAKASRSAHVGQAETIKALTKLMAGFSGEVASAAEASDLLFSIEKFGQTTFAELVPIIGDVASVSKQAGVSADEMGAALASLTQTAGSTGQAATQYRGILMALLKPQEKMQQILDAMGVSSGVELVRMHGLAGALQSLAAAAAAAGIPLGKLIESREALTGLGPLLETKFSGFVRVLEGMQAKVGQTEEAFKRWQETSEATEEIFRNTIGKVAVEFGAKMAPLIHEGMRKMSDWLTEHRSDIEGWAEDSMKAVTGLAQAVGRTADIYKSLPSDITGPAGYGLIGTMLFGRKAGAVIAVIAALHNGLDKFNRLLGGKGEKGLIEILGIFDPDQNGMSEFGKFFKALPGMVTGDRDWWTGELKRPSGLDLEAAQREGLEDYYIEPGRPKGKGAASAASADAALTKEQKKAWEDYAKEQRKINEDMYRDELQYRLKAAEKAREIDGRAFEDRKAALRAQAEEMAKHVEDEAALQAWLADETHKIDMEKLASAKDWASGAKLALASYADGAANAARETERVFGNAASSIEDAFVDMAMNMEFSFTNVIKSIEADLIRLSVRKAITAPLFNWLGGLFADGGVFDRSGLTPFARGGVVSRPTIFPFASGVGLMGEAGPEAIMPLTRLSSGRLGVGAQGGGNVVVNIVNNAPRTEVTQREGQTASGGKTIEVIIDEINARNAARHGSATDRALRGTYGMRPALVRR